MKIWFGSEPSFEDTVRAEVLDILNRDLTEKVFSTPWALGVTFPLVLAFMDLSASFAHARRRGAVASSCYLLLPFCSKVW